MARYCVDANVLETSGTRIGMPIAVGLVSDTGCDPVETGNLASVMPFQQDGPCWRAHLTAPQLRRRLSLSDA